MKKALLVLITFFLIASCNAGNVGNNGGGNNGGGNNGGGGTPPLPEDKFNLPIDRKALANRCAYTTTGKKWMCYNQFGLYREQWNANADGSTNWYHIRCYDDQGRTLKYKSFVIGVDTIPEYDDYCDGTGSFFEYK